ncbi:MAG: O-antigen ligase domain-containing protein [Pleurocapsa sp. MO_192.B19]|nr:O-antigen ligase domain-containing protein [Pleurocapsa sp. MO_192.B19]
MSPQAQVVILAWIPFVFHVFKRFPPQKAVIISFIVAWLFLPQRVAFALPLIPNYERLSATCYGILLTTFFYDAKRFRSFKFGWLDWPMTIWCLCAFASSISNGLGVYDGLSASLARIVAYGVPYFIGRIYLNNLEGMRQLAIGIFLGGLVYIPFCLLEVAISPQLHRMVYGYHGIVQFSQSIRYGGFRPNVFMQHGLSVGMWMMAATLIGIWLWQANVIDKICGFPIVWFVPVLFVTFVLVKSTGAYIYLLYGIVILFAAKWLRTAMPLLVLIVMISSYILMGATGSLTGERSDKIVAITQDITSPDRAQSLEFRLDNEELLGEKARQRAILGWGGWNRNRVFDYDYLGELVDITTTDSLWIIAFGVNGVIGLFAVFGSSLLPAFSFFWFRYPAHSWSNPKVAPAAMLATITTLYMLDCTLNNQPNPVFTLASGGIAGLVLSPLDINSLKIT